jgi:hypothetical protein
MVFCIKSDGFSPGTSGSRACCTLGLEGSGGKRQIGSSFVQVGAEPKLQSRLGGLESAGSLWDDIPGGILSLFSMGRLGLEVSSGLRVVG